VVAKEPALIEAVITGGDDYEVLACVPAKKVEALRQEASAAGVAVSEIGTVVAGQGEARLLGLDGKPLVLAQTSYSHF
jgi:thiamine-monophosphate kinase